MRHNSGAMPFLLSRLYRRLGQRYFYLFLAFEIGTAVLVTLGTVGLFTLYEEVSAAEFWKLVLFAEAFVALALVYAIVRASASRDPCASGSPAAPTAAARRTHGAMPSRCRGSSSPAAAGSRSRSS